MPGLEGGPSVEKARFNNVHKEVARGQTQNYKLGTTPIYSRSLEKKKVPAFWLLPKFSLVLGLLKSRISKNSFELLLRKLDFKLFHYKARVQPVSKITTIATRNRCWM